MTGLVAVLAFAVLLLAIILGLSLLLLPLTIIKMVDGDYWGWMEEVVDFFLDALPFIWILFSSIGFIVGIVLTVVTYSSDGPVGFLWLILSATDVAAIAIVHKK